MFEFWSDVLTTPVLVCWNREGIGKSAHNAQPLILLVSFWVHSSGPFIHGKTCSNKCFTSDPSLGAIVRTYDIKELHPQTFDAIFDIPTQELNHQNARKLSDML